MEDLFHWPEVLSQIQFLLNNTSFSTIKKTLNKVNYKFSFKKALDLFPAANLPNTFVTCTNIVNVIFFALMNQKTNYNRKYQPLFIKVRNWTRLRFHKSFSIFSSVEVTKKLIQQYIGPFHIIKTVGCLAYRLDIPSVWKIYRVFSIARLEPALGPSEDLF